MACRVWAVFLLLMPSIARSQSAGDSGSVSLSVNTSRPLAEMLDKVQHLYLNPISFEEAPYESSVDLKSIPVKQDDGSTISGDRRSLISA